MAEEGIRKKKPLLSNGSEPEADNLCGNAQKFILSNGVCHPRAEAELKHNFSDLGTNLQHISPSYPKYTIMRVMKDKSVLYLKD